ncbi:hypothetical protein ACPXB3_05165 [Gordonia sp. DT219]|uniref:hypothetical protein n=1 Tax=Gordonia sp. DT219 TaxID=3416658 RepID=UPI003CED7648
MSNANLAAIMIGGFLAFGALGAVLTLLIGITRDPPRPARWVPNPYPARSACWDPGRSWSDLIGRAIPIGLATACFIIPGLLLLSLGGTAAVGRPRRR